MTHVPEAVPGDEAYEIAPTDNDSYALACGRMLTRLAEMDYPGARIANVFEPVGMFARDRVHVPGLDGHWRSIEVPSWLLPGVVEPIASSAGYEMRPLLVLADGRHTERLYTHTAMDGRGPLDVPASYLAQFRENGYSDGVPIRYQRLFTALFRQTLQ